MSPNRWIAIGALLGGAAVGAGAFGAHGLKKLVTPEMLEVWRTGVLYHALHSLALVGFGLYQARFGGRGIAAGLMLAGTLIFAGSLYGLTLGAPSWLGAITPIGGVAMILGWVVFAVSAWRAKS
ncbi:MAG: DUF423 domain-containing protein [Planctomycetes bacterium]|nr:DUF423 domain-containing protein [Planctomycetota bacterium]